MSLFWIYGTVNKASIKARVQLV
ncbi:hypothetical protein NC653_034990 [Populus alba x Populus x berolinensis]|uniref:Uncharacterized protein n=1 Tax=Populus alba x Populus x berolinensis TaxID=444605 RepID=A0AAD6LNW3_9ROSI|nr:hypothetical protein NC653_034990 [Populus alba x Populus x berolinensis]